MSEIKKIEYFNLREEADAKKLPMLLGRREEIERLNRIVSRRVNSNAFVVGPDGIGKTILVYGWMQQLARLPGYESYPLVQLGTEHLYALDDDYELEDYYTEAFRSLSHAVVLIDNFGREVYKNPDLMQRVARLYAHILKKRSVHLILTAEPHEYEWLVREFPSFVHMLEQVQLKQQSAFEHSRILRRKIPRLNTHRLVVSDTTLQELISYAERFPTLGQLPQSAIHLLDEALSQSAAQGEKELTSSSIARIVEVKTGVPKARLAGSELESIKTLENDLNARVVNQASAIHKIATTLQRAKLGLRNPNRPLGSFLLLGPSGVGKTETAKSVAEILFGRAENVVRFDMSEFQQDHTVQRLIGAPAGYIGYEEGGALTKALRKEPHSLILLDEIEKAHPKVFDIFLQVLDDGRLTSGQNETVDARNAIVMATSNAGVDAILAAHAAEINTDDESLVRDHILPTLTKTFRLEFINRFDSILVFKPLTVPGLFQIAQLEIQKIEKRLGKHNVRFEIEPHTLRHHISQMADPRFGARPVKRFIEETCETLLVQSLLKSA